MPDLKKHQWRISLFSRTVLEFVCECVSIVFPFICFSLHPHPPSSKCFYILFFVYYWPKKKKQIKIVMTTFSLNCFFFLFRLFHEFPLFMFIFIFIICISFMQPQYWRQQRKFFDILCASRHYYVDQSRDQTTIIIIIVLAGL